MAKVVEGLFTTYEFTEEELAQGMQLTELQTKVVIHERAIRAQQQMLMGMDSRDMEQFKLDWQRSLGYMEALTWMLTCSEDVKNELRQALQEAQLEAEMQSTAKNSTT